MKSVFPILCVTIATFVNAQSTIEIQQSKITQTLDAYHQAAANSQFDHYFTFYTKDAIFIGTDPTENWTMDQLKSYAKKPFEQKRGWVMKPLERHIFFDETGNTAWFDELLDTSMKICRGSGVLVKVGNEWKLKQYVLSMTIPNDDVKNVLQVISAKQDVLLKDLKTAK